MAKQPSEQPSIQELWALLREQQGQITQLQALLDHRNEHEAGAEDHKSSVNGEVVSRAGLLKAAAMGAAGVAGAGTLLQNGAGVAGATGTEGQTTFTSATTTPTVTVNNTSTGLAVKANGSIQSSKSVTAKTSIAANPSTASYANAVVGQMSSTSAGSFSAAVRGQNLSTSAYGMGVYGTHNGAGIAVYGTVASGGFGGAFAVSDHTGTGVYGFGNTAVWGNGGEYGGTFSGTTGVNGSGSTGGAFYGSGLEAVYASGTSGAYGLNAISDTGSAIYATTGGYECVYAYSSDPNGNGVVGSASGTVNPYGVWGVAPSNGYAVYASGNMAASGTKSAVVPAADGTHRKLYCVESPECWFEDFGTAQLVNGHASVTIDPVFAGVVHSDLYHIFLTANGDSRGLFVASKSAGGFEVREQEGGRSTLTFSYRIVARRKDVVAPRLEPVTIKEPPARPAPRILKQPTPKKPVLDPSPNANVVQDPTA